MEWFLLSPRVFRILNPKEAKVIEMPKEFLAFILKKNLEHHCDMTRVDSVFVSSEFRTVQDS